MLLSGCCRVRSTPEVWPWNLKRQERGSRAPKRSRVMRAPDAPARAELGDLLEQTHRDVKEKSEARQKGIGLHAARAAVLGVLDRRGEGKAHGLGGRSAGLLHVLPHHRHRIPVGYAAIAEFGVVGEDAPRAGERNAEEHVVGDVVAQVVALVGCAPDRAPVDAAPFCGREQEGEQGKRRRIVHGAGSARQIDAGEALLHVLGGIEHHTAGAEQLRVHLVHVIAAEHRIARYQRYRGGALGDHLQQARVVVGRRAQADQLALRPGAAAVHAGVNAAGIGRLARIAEFGRIVALPVLRRVQGLDLDAGTVARGRGAGCVRRVFLLPAHGRGFVLGQLARFQRLVHLRLPIKRCG